MTGLRRAGIFYIVAALFALTGCGGGGSNGGGAAGVGSLAGTVSSSVGGQPIMGANVSVIGTQLTTTTNQQGGFSLPGVPGGSVSYTITASGFQSALITAAVPAGGQSVLQNITLTAFASGSPNWHDLSANIPTAAQITDISAIGGNLWLASRTSGAPSIYRSGDGGVSFLPVTSAPTDVVNRLYFFSTLYGVALSSGSQLYSTLDAGETWVSQYISGISSGSITGFDKNGWAVGPAGAVAHYTLLPQPAENVYTWSAVDVGTFQDLYAVSFPYQPLVGFIIGKGSFVLQTTDGGFTWKKEVVSSPGALRAMYWLDSTHGWAVGDQGCILYYNGTQWIRQSTPTTNNLRDIAFLDTSNGWAVGENGTILHTTNGGLSWVQEAKALSYQTLLRVAPVSTTEIYAVGSGRTLLKYSK